MTIACMTWSPEVLGGVPGGDRLRSPAFCPAGGGQIRVVRSRAMPPAVARFAPFVVAATLAAGCTLITGRSAPPAGLPAPIREVLPNGVRVIVQEHRASDVAALQLWVRAGGRDETPSELGLAH